MKQSLSKLSIVAAILVSLEFMYIFYLETLATASQATSKVFNIPVEVLQHETVDLLFKNQGVYNLMIAAVILFAVFWAKNKKELLTVMLVFILVVAAYGGVTSNISILFKQGGLPLLALITLYLPQKKEA